ncbi:hypothetical protein PPL_11285 [Heterostelium album PN500]|uniref:Aerobactin siderophore biosynthesis IucA/IucC N-terminal domain-containing protein n=1 Tax=Heterostelium pallidum (strain ATCC 26659 / Pp 5 / PN500) TaxID=670386 RepID=D3BU25_HETP5|nr:hypothetical protein PPL_11285 [Heterostelium album PN500]EFA75211.1 hypothetical protein PPL_11285 [Heterostelium album PN500]|eukprot:XP_020427345.1 hypothetical protein PPL_11285 [Heterostelium album PN500]
MENLDLEIYKIKDYLKYPYFEQILSFVLSQHKNNKIIFIQNLEIAQKSSFQKLLVSIIREQLLPFISTPLILKPNTINTFQFKSSSLESSDIIKDQVVVANVISFKVKEIFGFQFFTFEHPVVCRTRSNSNEIVFKEINNCLELIELLRENDSFSEIDRFKEEIVNSFCNMALISTLAQDNLNEIKQTSLKNNLCTLSEYSDFKSKKESSFDKFLFYDQLHIIGHNIHPCCKLRSGFNCEEVVQYAYELNQQIPIRFIGLHKSVGRYSMIDENDNPSDYFQRLFPSDVVGDAIQLYCKDNQLNINDYLICPMHPFQTTNTLPNQFKEELDNRVLIIFPESIQVPSYSTASIRNVIPVIDYNTCAPHIKFSLPIQLTSALRLITKRCILMGTSISKVLTKISSLEGSPFNERVIFLQELGGIYHSNNEEQRYQNFSMIWKENSNKYLRTPNDQPISSCSLFNTSPIPRQQVNHSILSEILYQYIDNKCIGMIIENGVNEWFKRYTTLLLEPFIILFTKQGEPVLLMLKDWSGCNVMKERLLKHQESQLNKGDGIPLSLIEEIPPQRKLGNLGYYKTFAHSVLQNHIGQIIIQICKEFTMIDETNLWDITYQVMRSQLLKLKSSTAALYNQVIEDERYLFSETSVKCTSLTAMRLITNYHLGSENVDLKSKLLVVATKDAPSIYIRTMFGDNLKEVAEITISDIMPII